VSKGIPHMRKKCAHATFVKGFTEPKREKNKARADTAWNRPKGEEGTGRYNPGEGLFSSRRNFFWRGQKGRPLNFKNQPGRERRHGRGKKSTTSFPIRGETGLYKRWCGRPHQVRKPSHRENLGVTEGGEATTRK